MCRRMICLISLVIVLNMASGALAALVAHWPFDEGSGTVAHDASGNGHDGSFEGSPQWTNPGWNDIGWCLRFGGAGDRATVEPFDLTGSGITLAAWINVITFQDDARIISKSEGSGTPDHYWAMILSGNDENNLEFRLRTDTGGTTRTSSPDTEDLQTDEWTHVAVTWDAGDPFMRFFKNGQEIFSQDKAGNAVGTNPDVKIAIGNQSASVPDDGKIRPFGGLLDDVVIYDRALDAEEIGALMLGLQKIPYARGPDPADGALVEDTWVNLSWTPGDFAISHDVYLGDNFDGVNNATNESETFRGNQTTTFYVAGFPGFAYPDGLVAGTTYYWRIDEVNEADPNSPWKGDIWSFSIPPKTAYNPDPVDGAEVADPNSATLSWTPGYGAKLHTVYFGDNYDEMAHATVGVPAGSASYSPGTLEREKVYYWRIDEFDGFGTYKGDVWTFTTPGAVGDPQPGNGATNVAMATILSWAPADNAASHQIYLGPDKDTVRSADTTSPEYKDSVALGAESYDPGLLEPETMYYWRVDGVYGGNPVKGPVWSFTVGNYLLVDDFESYTDDDTAGEAIWQTWTDGLDVADNGAQVGYLFPPYCEQTIVHGGAQSMPLLYANEAGVTNSEASLTLTANRDWTTEGVGELSLWFRGSSANAAEPLYVAVSNRAGAPSIVAQDDPDAATALSWTQWRIPLQVFADRGINLTNVDKIGIGLGSKGGAAVGGTGTVYIDDIRLYRPAP